MSRERWNQMVAVLASAVLTLGACGGVDEEEETGLEGADIEDAKADSTSRVKASTDKSQYGLQDPIQVTVANNYKVTAIYLPGCNATGLQQKSGSTWKDVGPEKACFWEGFATKVGAGSSLQDSFMPKPAGTYRVKVQYKTKCSKQTFSQCKSKAHSVYSAAFTVAQASGICASDKDCASTEYCHFPDGACLKATLNLMTGTCKVRPQYCIEIYKPVCGCDGKTYGNDCFAASAGTSVASAGECNNCFGAWLDQNGNCRGPADGVLPLSCCGEPCGKKVCAPQQTCCVGMPFPEPTCWNGNICPISKRAYKTDIHYLASGELEQLREALLKFKLATYRYKRDREAGSKHLGFIIDDVAPSPSVEAGGERVDLYGYASMAVAAVQLQAKQIAALQQEVAKLRRDLRRSH